MNILSTELDPFLFPRKFLFFSKILEHKNIFWFGTKILILINYFQLFMISFLPYLSIIKDSNSSLSYYFRIAFSFTSNISLETSETILLFITLFSIIFGIISFLIYYCFKKGIKINDFFFKIRFFYSLFIPTMILYQPINHFSLCISLYSENSIDSFQIGISVFLSIFTILIITFLIYWHLPLLIEHPTLSSCHYPSNLIPNSNFLTSQIPIYFFLFFGNILTDECHQPFFCFFLVINGIYNIYKLFKSPYFFLFDTTLSISIYFCHIFIPITGILIYYYNFLNIKNYFIDFLIFIIIIFIVFLLILTIRQNKIYNLILSKSFDSIENEDDLILIIQISFIKHCYLKEITDLIINYQKKKLSNEKIILYSYIRILYSPDPEIKETLSKLLLVHNLTNIQKFFLFEISKQFYLNYHISSSIPHLNNLKIQIYDYQNKSLAFWDYIIKKDSSNALKCSLVLEDEGSKLLYDFKLLYNFFHRENIFNSNDDLLLLQSISIDPFIRPQCLYERYSIFLNLPLTTILVGNDSIQNFQSFDHISNEEEIKVSQLIRSKSKRAISTKLYTIIVSIYSIWLIFFLLGSTFTLYINPSTYDLVYITKFTSQLEVLYDSWLNITLPILHLSNHTPYVNFECRDVLDLIGSDTINSTCISISTLINTINQSSILIQNVIEDFLVFQQQLSESSILIPIISEFLNPLFCLVNNQSSFNHSIPSSDIISGLYYYSSFINQKILNDYISYFQKQLFFFSQNIFLINNNFLITFQNIKILLNSLKPNFFNYPLNIFIIFYIIFFLLAIPSMSYLRNNSIFHFVSLINEYFRPITNPFKDNNSQNNENFEEESRPVSSFSVSSVVTFYLFLLFSFTSLNIFLSFFQYNYFNTLVLSCTSYL